MRIAVNMLEHSPRVKVRSGLHKATIARYVEVLECGGVFDPIVVFREKGTERYVIADGSHRIAAAEKTKTKELEADVREGDETAALKFALRCNTRHGLLRRDTDAMQCIRSLMLDPALPVEFQTNEERAALLEMSVRTFRRHFRKWTGSQAGSRREKELQELAQERAERRTTNKNKQPKDEPPARASASSSETSAAPPEVPAEDKPKRDKPAEGAKPDKSDRSKPKEASSSSAKPRAISHGEAHTIKRMVADAANCKESPEQCLAELGISMSVWKRAYAWWRNIGEHLE